MKKIEIFLASSSELHSDRKEFQIFILNENKILVEKNIYLKLINWEDFPNYMSKTRLQDEYNQAIIKNCDIFISLFYSKAGQFTVEEFEIAFNNFKATEKPLIYIFFKNFEFNEEKINEDIQTLIAFKKKIDSMGHYYTPYGSIEDLKFQIKHELNRLLADDFFQDRPEVKLIDVKVNNGDLVIKFLDKNENIIEEKKDFDEFLFPHIEIYDQKIKKLKNKIKKKDDELKEAIKKKNKFFNWFSSSKEKNDKLEYDKGILEQKAFSLEQSKSQVENQFRNYILSIKNKSIGESNLLYQRSLLLFLEGDINTALFFLNEEELENNEQIAEREREKLRKRDKLNAENRLLRANLLLYNGKIDEADINFQKAIELYPSKENRFAYGEFLFLQNRRSEAIEIFEKLMKDGTLPSDNNYGENWLVENQLISAKNNFYLSLCTNDYTKQTNLVFLKNAWSYLNILIQKDKDYDIKLIRKLQFEIFLQESYCHLDIGKLEKVNEGIKVLEDMKKRFDISNPLLLIKFMRLKASWLSASGDLKQARAIRNNAISLIEDYKKKYSTIEFKIDEALFYMQLTYDLKNENKLEYIEKALIIFEEASNFNEDRYSHWLFKTLIRKSEILFENKDDVGSLKTIELVLNNYDGKFTKDYPEHYDILGGMYQVKAKSHRNSEEFKEALVAIDESINYYNKSIELGKPKEYANKLFESIIIKVFILFSDKKDNRQLGVDTLLLGLNFIFENNPDSKKTQNQVNRCKKILKSFGGLNDSQLNEIIEGVKKVAGSDEENKTKCPRCLGNGYVDLNDIKRLKKELDWLPGQCTYCHGKGKVSYHKLVTVSVDE